MTPPFKSVSTSTGSQTWFYNDDTSALAVPLAFVSDGVLKELIRDAQLNAEATLVGFTPDTLRDLEQAAVDGDVSSITRDVPLTTGGTIAVTVNVIDQDGDPDTRAFYHLSIKRP